MRKYLKLFGFALICLSYMGNTLPLYIAMPLAPWKIRKILINFMRFYTLLAVKLFNLKTEAIEVENLKSHQGMLIVGNHMSYIDVLCILSHGPACFVTSVEIKNTPFLGHLCRLGGCLFVERRNRENLSGEVKEIRHALEYGLNVVIFPEATSTNGEEIKRFKRPLYQAAKDANKPVLPMTLNYLSIDHEEVDRTNRDYLCWYGDMSFFPHFMKFLSFKEVRASLTFSRPIVNTTNSDIEELASQSREMVLSFYRSL